LAHAFTGQFALHIPHGRVQAGQGAAQIRAGKLELNLNNPVDELFKVGGVLAQGVRGYLPV
jgi:hypothetical protein